MDLEDASSPRPSCCLSLRRCRLTCPRPDSQTAGVSCSPPAASPAFLRILSWAAGHTLLLFPIHHGPAVFCLISLPSVLPAQSIPFAASRMTPPQSKVEHVPLCFDGSTALRPGARWLPAASRARADLACFPLSSFFPPLPSKTNSQMTHHAQKAPLPLCTCSLTSPRPRAFSVLLGLGGSLHPGAS